jgi:hypothetical protein
VDFDLQKHRSQKDLEGVRIARDVAVKDKELMQ